MRAAAGGPTKRLALAGVVVATVALGLSACGTSKSTTASSSPSSSSSNTKLVYIQDSASWPTLDPGSSDAEGTDNPFFSLIYGNLFTVGTGNRAVPGLATSYNVSSNGLTFVLHLRSGVTFQDGTPFNSTAVKDSLEHDLSPKLDCECLTAIDAIKSITTPTATEVVIHLSHPDGTLLGALETEAPSFVLDPTALAKDGESKFGLSPVGAGPYRVVKNVPNATLTLQKWSGYWDAKAIHMKTIVVESQSDGSTELATMQSGGAQLLAFSQDPTEEKGALSDSHLNVHTSDDNVDANFLYLNYGKKPFNNKLAREAVFYATDQPVISRTIFDNYNPATEQFLGTSMVGYSGNTLPGYPSYNPKKAKALVKKLGGLSVTLTPLIGTDQWYVEECEALKKEWGAVGIKTTIDELSFPTVLSLLEKGSYQAVMAGYPPEENGTLALLGTLECPSYFDPSYCDKTVDADMKLAQASENPTQQTKYLREAMTRAIVTDFAFLPLYTIPGVVVMAKDLHGITVYGGQVYMAEAYYS